MADAMTGDLFPLALVLAPLPLTVPHGRHRPAAADHPGRAEPRPAGHWPCADGVARRRCARRRDAVCGSGPSPSASAGWSGRSMPVCAAGSASAWGCEVPRRRHGLDRLAQVPLLILVASLTALLAIGLVALSGRRIGATTRLPFGPFLALGLHAALALGPRPDASIRTEASARSGNMDARSVIPCASA